MNIQLMTRLLLPLSENEEQSTRIAAGVRDLPFDPRETELTVLNVFEEFEVTPEQWVEVEWEDFYDEDELPEVVASVAADLADDGYTVDVYRDHGDPVDKIVELGAEIDATAIVMATHQRGPIGKAMFGSVTQGVLLSADRPVIVIPKAEVEVE